MGINILHLNLLGLLILSIQASTKNESSTGFYQVVSPNKNKIFTTRQILGFFFGKVITPNGTIKPTLRNPVSFIKELLKYIANFSNPTNVSKIVKLAVNINGTKEEFRASFSPCPLLRCKRCPFGYVENDEGCAVCVCKKIPDCPDLRYCRKRCFFGYLEDKNGCKLCECRLGRELCPSVSNCKEQCYFGNELDENYCKTCVCKQKQACSNNQVAVTCYSDPCSNARCRGQPHAICQIDYCNGCFAKFYVKNKIVNCH